MISRVSAWFPHFPFRPVLVAQRGKRVTTRWLGSGRHACTSFDLLVPGTFGKLVPGTFGKLVPGTFGKLVPGTFGKPVPGTFGKLSVNCPDMSLDRHVRGGIRGNQAEVCVQVALGTLKLGCGELPDIVVADHVISRKQ